MKSISSCAECGVLSLDPPGGVCKVCFPGSLIPAGVLLESLDVAAIVAAEGDAILEECARALDVLEKRGT